MNPHSSILIAINGEAEGIDGRMGKGPRDGMQEIHTIYKLSANSPCFIIDQKLSPTIYKEKSYGYERWAMRHLFKKKMNVSLNEYINISNHSGIISETYFSSFQGSST